MLGKIIIMKIITEGDATYKLHYKKISRIKDTKNTSPFSNSLESSAWATDVIHATHEVCWSENANINHVD